jgi:hypothetical protein
MDESLAHLFQSCKVLEMRRRGEAVSGVPCGGGVTQGLICVRQRTDWGVHPSPLQSIPEGGMISDR